MDLLRCSTVQFPKTHLRRPFCAKLRPCFAVVRSSLSLPFLERKAKYYRELEAAVDVVERACRLCVDVLDPIDGTRGFVKDVEALYVVALALVVEGQIVLGVMGCPNWDEDYFVNCVTGVQETGNNFSRSGMIMVSYVGCGTWKQRLSDMLTIELSQSWTRCSVDGCQVLKEARFCTPESQKWESFPLSSSFNAKTNSEKIGKGDILLVPACCGSLCKYMMVASGRASVFLLRATTRKVMKKISGYAPAWDHAVGIICVHEAGGKVTDWEGSSIDFAADEAERRTIFPSGGFLVTNHSLHNEILGLISSNSPIN